ncbi:MAG: WD40 repeat domain-containing protein, partial [Stackebrandtia sp.]
HHELRLKPKPSHDDCPDGFVWAWSPDGERAACLTADGRVEVIDLFDAPHTITVVDAPDDAHGLWWGAGDILVMGGPGSLRFHDLNARRVLSDYRFGREVPKQRPLWNDTEDLGQAFRPNPTFALDAERWAVALPEGVVIAPDADQSTLDDHLAWVVDRRHAWPYRWGEATLVDDVASCFDKLTTSRKLLAPLRNQVAGSVAPAEWPPPNTATIDELYDVMVESVLGYGEGCTPHVADAIRHAAKQRARAGRPDAAESLIALIPPDSSNDHLRAQAEVGLILAAAGEHGFARRLLDDAARNASDLHEYHIPFVGAALGAGLAILGGDAGQEWIDRAIAAIDPNPNPWQHRISVCWALLEAGLEDQARRLWTEGEPGSPFHQSSWLAHLIRIGRADLVREFALAPDRPWPDNFYAWTVFTETGRADLMREFFAEQDRGIDESEQRSLDEAEANAATDRPNTADLAELRDKYERLQRTPLAQRREDTKRLAWRAAACHHYSAVLDLLRLLPMERDFNDRAATAERALWIALTSVDGDPW